jgi:hypothetical protein
MKKSLAVGIILLFIGTSITPTISCTKPENKYVDSKTFHLPSKTTSMSPLSSPAWTWAKSAGGTYPDIGCDIAVDIFGNTYVMGWYFGSVTFGDITLTSWGPQVFVAKLSSSGVWLWATSTTGEGNPQEYGGIAVDMFMNVYITGIFSQQMTFGNTTIDGYQGNVFIAKLDRNGAWQWAKGAGDAGVAIGLSISMDVSRNAYITGWFQGTSTFGDTTLTCSGDADVFVSKLNSDGSWLWATHADGSDLTGGRGIAVGIGGNVFVTGSFRGTAMFGNTTLTSSGEEDVFVAKLRQTNNFL